MAGAQYNMRNPAVKRLMKEAQELKDPTEQYFCQPLDDNLFEWHFTIRGPDDSDFESGIYHGRIILPPEYPMKPPSIILLTPNGRFELNAKICLSISGHHPESWRPSWSIRTAILAIIGFMPTHGNGAIGSLDYPAEERKKLARRSQEWKCQQCGSIKNLLKPVTEASKETQREAQELASQISFKAEGEKKKDVTPSPEEKENTQSTAQTMPSSTRQSATPGYPPFAYPQNMMFPPVQGMPQFPQTTQAIQGPVPQCPQMPFHYPFGQMPMMGMYPGQVPTSNQGQLPTWPQGGPFNPFMPFMPYMPPTTGGPYSFPGMPPGMGMLPGMGMPPGMGIPAGMPNQFMPPVQPGATAESSRAQTTTPSAGAIPRPVASQSVSNVSSAPSSISAPSSPITSAPAISTTDSELRQRSVRQVPQAEETPEAIRNMQYAELHAEVQQPPLIDTFSFIVFILCSIGIALLTMRRLGLFDALLDEFQ